MITREKAKQFSADFSEAVAELGTRYGMNITLKDLSICEDKLSGKLECKPKEVSGIPYEKVEFEKYCRMYGFTPDQYGAEFSHRDKTYKLVGFFPSSPKYCLCGECAGTRYKFPRNAFPSGKNV